MHFNAVLYVICAVYGSARCKASLTRLCDAALAVDGRSPMAYGLACIFSLLTISKDELQREALKDKEVTPEQYEQLQKVKDFGMILVVQGLVIGCSVVVVSLLLRPLQWQSAFTSMATDGCNAMTCCQR